MASIKELKRDINFLMEEVIETCFLHYHLRNESPEKREEIDQLIEEVIMLRNDLIYKINNPDESIKKGEFKKYYNELFATMMAKVDDTFTKLGTNEQ